MITCPTQRFVTPPPQANYTVWTPSACISSLHSFLSSKHWKVNRVGSVGDHSLRKQQPFLLDYLQVAPHSTIYIVGRKTCCHCNVYLIVVKPLGYTVAFYCCLTDTPLRCLQSIQVTNLASIGMFCSNSVLGKVAALCRHWICCQHPCNH